MLYHADFNQQDFLGQILLMNSMSKQVRHIGKHQTRTNQSEHHENPSWSFQQGVSSHNLLN